MAWTQGNVGFRAVLAWGATRGGSKKKSVRMGLLLKLAKEQSPPRVLLQNRVSARCDGGRVVGAPPLVQALERVAHEARLVDHAQELAAPDRGDLAVRAGASHTLGAPLLRRELSPASPAGLAERLVEHPARVTWLGLGLGLGLA